MEIVDFFMDDESLDQIESTWVEEYTIFMHQSMIFE